MLYGVSEKFVCCFQVCVHCCCTLNNGFHSVSAEMQVDFAVLIFKFVERNIDGITNVANQFLLSANKLCTYSVVRCDIQIKNKFKTERHCVPFIILLHDSENDLCDNFPMAMVWKGNILSTF